MMTTVFAKESWQVFYKKLAELQPELFTPTFVRDTFVDARVSEELTRVVREQSMAAVEKAYAAAEAMVAAIRAQLTEARAEAKKWKALAEKAVATAEKSNSAASDAIKRSQDRADAAVAELERVRAEAKAREDRREETKPIPVEPPPPPNDPSDTRAHEAGHALANAYYFPNTLADVEIKADGGVVHWQPRELTNLNAVYSQIRVHLAGHAAVEVTSGKRPRQMRRFLESGELDQDAAKWGHDLAQVKAILAKHLGMREFGLHFRRLVESQYDGTMQLLATNRKPLETLAARLAETPRLDGKEAVAVMGPLQAPTTPKNVSRKPRK